MPSASITLMIVGLLLLGLVARQTRRRRTYRPPPQNPSPPTLSDVSKADETGPRRFGDMGKPNAD